MISNLIKNWYFERIGDNVVLCGEIYNDTKGRFRDGTPIRTSRVVQADFLNGVVLTKNSVYYLDLTSRREEENIT